MLFSNDFRDEFGQTMARLQNKVDTKDFFRGTNFLMKNAPRFSLIFLSLFCS